MFERKDMFAVSSSEIPNQTGGSGTEKVLFGKVNEICAVCEMQWLYW